MTTLEWTVNRISILLFLVVAVLAIRKHGAQSLTWAPYLCMAIGLLLNDPRIRPTGFDERLRQPRQVLAMVFLAAAALWFARDLYKLSG